MKLVKADFPIKYTGGGTKVNIMEERVHVSNTCVLDDGISQAWMPMSGQVTIDGGGFYSWKVEW